MPTKYVFHLLPNAHLDPVWLWDWREGLNEGLITVRTILDLMDEFPELTFIRGESSIYEHIELTHRPTFERIRRLVEAGRWDIIGGTYNQPDTNLAATETLCRQYERGLSYFESRFGFRPSVAWQADSFGHTPGLPNILSSFGMESFAFTRPMRGQFPMQEPAFWWQGNHQNRILCYRQYWMAYCSERHNLLEILDTTLEGARKEPLVHVGVLMGLGNHGGGPSRRHIQDARDWAAAHPEVELRFSTLHGFFKDLGAEITETNLQVPVWQGDMGFCLRGCYSSVMKFKAPYRRSETGLAAAEIAQGVIGAATQTPARTRLEAAWDGVLFNSFHDVLPGSSIERAMEDQIALTGQVIHTAQEAQLEALNILAERVDTSVPAPAHPDKPTDVPILVWNGQAKPYQGWVELEACLDYRPDFKHSAEIGSLPLSLDGPSGEPVAFQEIDTEHHAMRGGAWRKRLLVHTEIPALGWKVFRLGRREEGFTPAAPEAAKSACAARDGDEPLIENEDWSVSVSRPGGLLIRHRGANFLGGDGILRLQTFKDIWGSWGGMDETPDSIKLREALTEWEIREAVIRESGPERVALWTRWEGGRSWMDLTFYLSRDAREVRVKSRLLWNERSARLKLMLPGSGKLEMQVPGSRAERPQVGHLPAGRWVRRGDLGFISDVLSDVDATEGGLGVTLARASRYANDVKTEADAQPWLPAVDCGELKYEFWLAPGDADLEALSRDLLCPPATLTCPAARGDWADSGSLGHLEPSHLQLLSATDPDGQGLRVRVQNPSAAKCDAWFVLAGQRHALGTLLPFQIRTVKLS